MSEGWGQASIQPGARRNPLTFNTLFCADMHLGAHHKSKGLKLEIVADFIAK